MLNCGERESCAFMIVFEPGEPEGSPGFLEKIKWEFFV